MVQKYANYYYKLLSIRQYYSNYQVNSAHTYYKCAF